MGAIAGLLLTVLAPGDEVVVLGPLYGGTGGLLHELLARYGVRTIEAGGGPERPTAERLKEAVGPRTKVIYVETPTNPTLTVHDLDAVAAAGRASGALTVADNTFATPYLTRPLEHGLDAVLHSATKYLGGHSDLLLGALVTKDQELAGVLKGRRDLFGAVPGTLESWLALRGMRTLHLRVERATANAVELARRLAEHPAVARVRHPGFGAIVSIELAGGAMAADLLTRKTKLWVHTTSLGGVESTFERRRRWKLEPTTVSEALVRLSVGVEDVDDLWADLSGALDDLTV